MGNAMNAVLQAGGDLDRFLSGLSGGQSAAGSPTSGPGGGGVASGSLQDYARQAAQRMGIDPDIFTRQIQQESGFNPNAGSPAGAQGVAQFMPSTARGLGVDTSDPYSSLDGAARLMRSNLDKYGGDYGKALAAYNAGGGAVDRYGGIPPFEETQRYVKTILGGAGQKVKEFAGAVGRAVGDLSQFGDPQLTNDEAYAACGPAAAVRFAQRFGRNPSLREATDLAQSVGWTSAQGMAGLGSEQALMNKLGVPTKLVQGADWGTFANEARTGNPVTISTRGHYFTADGWDPQTNRFHVGRSGLDLKGGAEWMTPEQMTALMGDVQGGLLADNPQVASPSIADQESNPLGWLDKAKQSMADSIAPPKSKPAMQLEGAAVDPRQSAVFNSQDLDWSALGGAPQQQMAAVGQGQPLDQSQPQVQAQPEQNVWDKVGSGIADVFRNAFSPSGGPMSSAMQPTPSDTLTNPLGTGNAQANLPQPSQPGLPVRQDLRDIAQAPQPTIFDQARAGLGIDERQRQIEEGQRYLQQQRAEQAPSGPLEQAAFDVGRGAELGAAESRVETAADVRSGEQLATGVIDQAKVAGWQPTPDQERVAYTVLSQVTPMNVLLTVSGAPGGGLVGGSGRAAARALAESALGLGLNIAGTTVASEAAQSADLPGPLQLGAGIVGGAAAQLTGHATVAGATRAAEYFGTPEGQAALRSRQRAQFSLDPRGAAEEEAAAAASASGAPAAPVTGAGVLQNALDRLGGYPEDIAAPLREWAATTDAPQSQIGATILRWMEENPPPPGARPASTPVEETPPVAARPVSTPSAEQAAGPATAEAEANATANTATAASGDPAAVQDLSRRITYEDLADVRRKAALLQPPGPTDPAVASPADRIQAYMTSNMLIGPHSAFNNITSQTEQLARPSLINLLAGYPDEAVNGVRMLAAATQDGFRGAADAWATGRSGGDLADSLSHAPIGIEAPGLRMNAGLDEIYRTWGRAQGMAIEATRAMAENPGLSKAEVLDANVARINAAGQKSGAWSVFNDGPNAGLGAQISGWRTRLTNDPDPLKKLLGWGLYAIAPFSRIPETIWNTGIKRTSPINEILGTTKMIKAARAGDVRGVRLAAAETTLDTAINLYIFNQASEGNITAKDDPEHPWSIRLPGNNWLDYRSLGPVATRLGAIASLTEANRESANKLNPSVLVNTIDKTSNLLMNEWFLGPLVGLLDTARTGNISGAGSKFLTQLGDRVLPAGALANYIEQSTDPVLRDPSKELPTALWERQQSHIPDLGIPGLSNISAQRLPARVSTTTGEAMPRANYGWTEALTGVENDVSDPVKRELAELDRAGFSTNVPPESTRTITIANSEIPLSEDERRTYLAARGHFLTDRFKQYETQYQGWTPEAKARFWSDMLGKSSEAGKAELINKTWGGLQSPETQQKIREGHRVVGRLEPLAEPTPTTGRP
jgi:hypothetical protein